MTVILPKPPESHVRCRDGQGLEHRASLIKLSRFQVVFEVCGADCPFRLSEVLKEFRIVLDDTAAYSGRAVVSNLASSGSAVICEASLEDPWEGGGPVSPGGGSSELAFQSFLQRWQSMRHVMPEFKLVVADLQAFLTQLRLWAEQAELGIQMLPADDQVQAQRDAAIRMESAIRPALGALFDQFEQVCRRVEPGSAALHAAYCRRQLHPLLLTSPFMNRIFVKPLGYAGDYEMVNMILRDACEGGSLFAKLLNIFILAQVPAVAHRNRVSYLTRKLNEETLRCHGHRRGARIMNFGCGPAREMQDFLRDHELSEHASMDLMDFDADALSYTKAAMERIQIERRRGTPLKFIRKSVQQVLLQIARATRPVPEYDFVYCAGLFDYLNDRTCAALIEHFHDMLVPGGLLVVTNVESQHPIRNIMDYIFEWHLVYRNGRDLGSLAPPGAPEELISVKMDATAGNIFLEIRKPLHLS